MRSWSIIVKCEISDFCYSIVSPTLGRNNKVEILDPYSVLWSHVFTQPRLSSVDKLDCTLSSLVLGMVLKEMARYLAFLGLPLLQ